MELTISQTHHILWSSRDIELQIHSQITPCWTSNITILSSHLEIKDTRELHLTFSIPLLGLLCKLTHLITVVLWVHIISSMLWLIHLILTFILVTTQLERIWTSRNMTGKMVRITPLPIYNTSEEKHTISMAKWCLDYQRKEIISEMAQIQFQLIIRPKLQTMVSSKKLLKRKLI